MHASQAPSDPPNSLSLADARLLALKLSEARVGLEILEGGVMMYAMKVGAYM